MASAAFTQPVSGDPLDQAARAPRIAIGPLVVGEDHPGFALADFPAVVEDTAPAVEARWVEGSLKWVRAPDGLALPLARLRIALRVAPERALLRWRGRAVLFQGGPDGAATEIFVPLLEGAEAAVELDGHPLARVRIAARAAATPAAERHAIDHSCSPWAAAIRGLDDAFVSMNCRLIPVGRVGAEAPLLEIRWLAAGVTLPDGSRPPLLAQLRHGLPARMTVIGPDGKSRVVEISAAVPPRWHRLKVAAGAGPYRLASSAGAGNGAAGSLMLYGNLRLRPEDSLSIRVFEAAVAQSPADTAFFNNLGLYFAYDLARVLDNRLALTALLGLQGVTFAPAGLSRSAYNEAVFPQGFELSYLDAFGLRNKTLSGGMFLQPTASKPYQNFWGRFGGRWFGELNYISWRSGGRSARMWGFSIGVPFVQLF